MDGDGLGLARARIAGVPSFAFGSVNVAQKVLPKKVSAFRPWNQNEVVVQCQVGMLGLEVFLGLLDLGFGCRLDICALRGDEDADDASAFPMPVFRFVYQILTFLTLGLVLEMVLLFFAALCGRFL